MDTTIKQRFSRRWETYFPGAELPIVVSYSDEIKPGAAEPPPDPRRWHCLICDLASVRRGTTRFFEVETLGCGGARRHLGFDTEVAPDFAYFLSCGIPGELEGERYKQSPELVERYLARQPAFEAPGRTIVFKRWDALEEADAPDVVVFFAGPDVLSGLFTLANFDEVGPHGVIAPFGSGCSSVVSHPYQELRSEHPRAVLGMFDVSARPCVSQNVLTFAVPWPKFVRMVGQMDESFLVTHSWQEVRGRI